MLKETNFIIVDNAGALQELRCRICGTPIAKRQTVEGRKRLKRFPSYAEIKIAFKDGSHHVTHSCRTCVEAGIKPDMLQAMYDLEYPQSGREALGIVNYDFECKGIA